MGIINDRLDASIFSMSVKVELVSPGSPFVVQFAHSVKNTNT